MDDPRAAPFARWQRRRHDLDALLAPLLADAAHGLRQVTGRLTEVATAREQEGVAFAALLSAHQRFRPAGLPDGPQRPGGDELALARMRFAEAIGRARYGSLPDAGASPPPATPPPGTTPPGSPPPTGPPATVTRLPRRNGAP